MFTSELYVPQHYFKYLDYLQDIDIQSMKQLCWYPCSDSIIWQNSLEDTQD